MTWGTQPVGLYAPTYYYYYQQKKTPPPKSVPTWEKMFCWKVGNVPWRRLEETKKYMYQHESIAKWNDLAGETAFKKAKRRYWAETNGLPISRDLSLPPPYMYSGDIDWNSPSNDIDPEVILDLEKSLVPKSDDEVKIVDCNDDHDAVIIGLTSVGVNLSKYGVGWGGEFEDEELKEKENVNEEIEEIVCEDAGCIDLKIYAGRWDSSAGNYLELAY